MNEAAKTTTEAPKEATSIIEFSAKSNKPEFAGRIYTGEFDLGKDCKEAVQKFGTEIVYNLFRQKAIVHLQDIARRGIAQKNTDEEITATVASCDFKTAVRKVGAKKKDALDTITDQFTAGKITEAQRNGMIEAELLKRGITVKL